MRASTESAQLPGRERETTRETLGPPSGLRGSWRAASVTSLRRFCKRLSCGLNEGYDACAIRIGAAREG